ncbi:unnamed protein product [Diatraea saccharalis]|uniref:Reverse transcriptase/retrotransposon-derived protein RNase H-like domain-containing protein n=1 Tax=Diatraea saccharalis TaxID=40085 RepID=A0A9N9N0J7_9NEOP|nr:unnamed protein product [Diatraea saccharalis]
MPNMSKMTAPVRQLTCNNVDWTWSSILENSLKSLKDAVVNAPILQYFDTYKEVVIQYDASKDLNYIFLDDCTKIIISLFINQLAFDSRYHNHYTFENNCDKLSN